MDTKQIEKNIASIASRGAKLDGDIQRTGLAIIEHVEQHGDVTLANRLYCAMPKGSRSNALLAWFLEFGKFSVTEDRKVAKEAPLTFDRSKQTDVAGAQAKPWHEFKKAANPADEFNLAAELEKFQHKIQAAVEKGKVPATDPMVQQIMHWNSNSPAVKAAQAAVN